ncbi:MAG: methylmalonyl-CoA mutase, partial [Deltaproteobacteria bacterium]
IRVTIQALAAVMGGTQSLHTNSMDETLALPTEEAVTLALRTQQIIAEESGVANTIDPLGGAYFIEALTNRMEKAAMEYIDKIEEMGGVIRAIELGYQQKEIARAAYHYQQQIDKGEKTMIGVNKYTFEEQAPIETLKVPAKVENEQVNNLKNIKDIRDNAKVKSHLKDLENAARGRDNLMPFILKSVKEYATLGEICDVLRRVFGTYQDPALF